MRAVIACLLGSATAFAQPPREPPPATESYRLQTFAVDGVGLALLVAGGLAEGEGGRDTQTSETLFTVGSLAMVFGAPIVHGIRGHRERAVGSTLLRVGLAGAGMLVAVQMNSGCGDGDPPEDGALFDDDFLCELDYAGYGVLGGLVLASVLDAAFMTDETVAPARWSPQLAATRDGGVRAGLAFAW